MAIFSDLIARAKVCFITHRRIRLYIKDKSNPEFEITVPNGTFELPKDCPPDDLLGGYVCASSGGYNSNTAFSITIAVGQKQYTVKPFLIEGLPGQYPYIVLEETCRIPAR